MKHPLKPWRLELWKNSYWIITSSDGIVARRIDKKSDAQLMAAAPHLVNKLTNLIVAISGDTDIEELPKESQLRIAIEEAADQLLNIEKL